MLQFCTFINITLYYLFILVFNVHGDCPCSEVCDNTLPIEMSHSTLEDIREYVDTNPTIVSLSLKHNNLTHIPADIFTRLPKLTCLDLSYNEIVDLQGDVLVNATCLQRLHLSHNAIRHVPSGLFGAPSSQRRIIVFDISYNQVKSIGLDVFHEGLVYLKTVNVSYNKLDYFEPWPYRLRPLGLDNGCPFLPRNPSTYTNFNAILSTDYHFDVSQNDIKRFVNSRGLVQDEQQYFQVNLTFNQLTDVAQCLNTLFPTNLTVSKVALARLDIHNNPIVCDCRMYDFVKMLNESIFVDKSRDYLTCQNPPEVRHKQIGELMTNPEALFCNLTDFCPTGCICQDRPFENHLLVDCSLQSFSELPLVLPRHPRIVLNMSGNHLVHVDNRIYIANLTQLDMSYNNITTLDAAIFKESIHLQFLDLSHNSLQYLPPTIVRLSFSQVRLHDNPIQCSCGTVWVNDWARLNERVDDRSPSMTCSVNGAKQELLATYNNLRCIDKNTVIIIACSVSGVIIAGVIVVVLMACKWKYEANVICYRLCGMCLVKKNVYHAMNSITNCFNYDMYISCNSDNAEIRQWVMKYFFGTPRNGTPYFKCYYPFIHDLPGESRPDVIQASMAASRKILLVLDADYEQNDWLKEEWWMAHETCDKVIVLLYHSPETFTQIETEPIKTYISQKQYIQSSDIMLRLKLNYELHRNVQQSDVTNADTDGI